ncbi:MAG: hypothetical protein GHCLOJNM_04596 [bacterium]|nr:hypothetical protein [bacterium]
MHEPLSHTTLVYAVPRHGEPQPQPLPDRIGGVSAQRARSFLERLGRASDHCLARAEYSIAHLARALGLSERQLQRKLRASLNRCPRAWLRELQLQRATQLLSEGHAPGDVAIHTGFSSHSHFGARFKERFGVTPGVYVRRQASDPAAQRVLEL